MATAATKLRKRTRRAEGYPAETRHTVTPKTPTPLEDRAFVTNPVFRKIGDAKPAESTNKAREGGIGKRSRARAQRFIESGGIKR